MSNLSKEKRDKMISFLESLRTSIDDEKSVIALNEIENEINSKRYGLVWERHQEEVDEKMISAIPVFSEVPSKRITSQKCESFNFILEGDNLHSLKLLEKTHKGKVDVIYIDPPYGTGGKDFIYDDSFVDKTDTFRHSKWISFINVRLRIARELLTENGVIFISIDDNELYSLKLLCDDIFGEEAFVTNMIWQKKTGASDAKGIATITEYILVYVKNPDNLENIFDRNYEAFDISRYRYKDEYYERRGPFYYDSLDRGSVRYSDALNYPVIAPDGTEVYPNGRKEFENDGWTWKWSKEKLQWGIENGFIDISPSDKKANGWAVRYKIYLKVDNEDCPIDKSAPYKNMITTVLNANAAADIKSMFDGRTVFQYSKPVELIKMLLSFVKKKDGIVLDFFAGSGTTGQAVLEQNMLDNSNRNFILCTNNQNEICEKITYERIKRRIQGYKFKGKKEDILFERTIVLEDLLNESEIKSTIERIMNKYSTKYQQIKKQLKEGVLKVIGINTYDDEMPGIPANLKYYTTKFIDKYSADEFYSVGENLMSHIREMVELENHVEIDGIKRVLILTDEDADEFEHRTMDSIKKCEVVYLSTGVLLNADQEKLLSGKLVVSVPDYYFEQELIETGEL